MKIKFYYLRAILFVISALSSALTYATGSGLYLGVMAGPATNQSQDQYVQLANSNSFTLASPNSNQIGGRMYVGYKFNSYGGIESGLTYFSTINYDTINGAATCTSPRVNISDVDLVGVGTLPIGSFGVFVKAGVAGMYESTSGAITGSNVNDCGNTSNIIRVRGTASVGASYDISQTWVADVSWTRLMTKGIIQNMDLYALGISYHFVDQYCGQFLC